MPRIKSDIRDLFRDLIADGSEKHRLTDAFWAGAQVAQLLGQLYHSTDTLEGDDCELLDLPRGSTYAQAAREIKTEMRKRTVRRLNA